MTRAAVDLTAAGVADAANRAYTRVDARIATQRRTQRIPGNTCPAIDAVLRDLRKAYDAARRMERESECAVARDYASEIECALSGLEDKLEEIRAANETLRDLGTVWYEIADAACEELGEVAVAALRAADADAKAVPA